MVRGGGHIERNGSVPEEMLEGLDSEVHHLKERTIEDRANARQVDKRLQDVEREVHALRILSRWCLGVASGTFIAVLAGIAAVVLNKGVHP